METLLALLRETPRIVVVELVALPIVLAHMFAQPLSIFMIIPFALAATTTMTAQQCLARLDNATPIPIYVKLIIALRGSHAAVIQPWIAMPQIHVMEMECVWIGLRQLTPLAAVPPIFATVLPSVMALLKFVLRILLQMRVTNALLQLGFASILLNVSVEPARLNPLLDLYAPFPTTLASALLTVPMVCAEILTPLLDLHAAFQAILA
jgi:hypothetical protein